MLLVVPPVVVSPEEDAPPDASPANVELLRREPSHADGACPRKDPHPRNVVSLVVKSESRFVEPRAKFGEEPRKRRRLPVRQKMT